MNSSMNFYPGKPTMYRGITFRSRLETQWAYFLDQCNIEWSYEPQRMRLNEDIEYVPDFYLGTFDCWLEVKGCVNKRAFLKPMHLWNTLDNMDRKVVIGLRDGEVIVPHFLESGEMSLDGAIIECSSCHGVWFANLLDQEANQCPHCSDLGGGTLSLSAAAMIKRAKIKTRWIGSHNPLAYRNHISDAVAA